MEVLLVEDDDNVRAAIVDLLGDAGLNVTASPVAEDALRAIGEIGRPELIITDLDLGPGMDGLTLGSVVARTWPEIGIIFITGRPWLMRTRELRSRERFLSKPFSFCRLLKVIGELREERGAHLSARPA